MTIKERRMERLKKQRVKDAKTFNARGRAARRAHLQRAK